MRTTFYATIPSAQTWDLMVPPGKSTVARSMVLGRQLAHFTPFGCCFRCRRPCVRGEGRSGLACLSPKPLRNPRIRQIQCRSPVQLPQPRGGEYSRWRIERRVWPAVAFRPVQSLPLKAQAPVAFHAASRSCMTDSSARAKGTWRIVRLSQEEDPIEAILSQDSRR